MNQDFVRDPVGYVASNSSPVSSSATIPTTRDTPSQTTTSAALSYSHVPTQSPPVVVDSASLMPSNDAQAPEYIADSSSDASMTETGSDDLINTPSSLNDGRDVPTPIRIFLLPSWIGIFRFLPSLWSLGVGTFSFRNTSCPSCSLPATPEPPIGRVSSSLEPRRFGLSSLVNSYKGCREILKKSLAFRSG
ncbi:hypothetical protein BDM02DRAFT_3118431 [Thelephora ganbajun]|uniref:Uncharacterized protein n=1 Tax=Thelephora ganbajun TaxID=370292 RepID=A0ACB6ZBC9_THEGA|nr:hypothetical protein BDM02DRAFT_3118431 [Thelephora ganbajun]